MPTTRVRIAPSPTGLFHLGSLRTALTNYLFAKKTGGVFLVRVEDTDQSRLVPEAIPNMLQSMEWAGIKIDEGVTGIKNARNKAQILGAESLSPKEKYANIKKLIVEKGKFGPYLQSERLEIYRKYAQELIAKKAAYYCFCPPERLEKLRKRQEEKKLPPKYDRHCLCLPEKEIKRKIKEGAPYVLRLKVPKEGTTSFHDLIRGKIEVENKNLDDPVLLKTDGFPTYHFAVVVDDHLMKITHVFRGEEWIPSTPKHILIYKALNWKIPAIGHLPNILNLQGRKLSKRDGDFSIEDLRKKGYLPEAVINFIALLGWNPKTEQEIFSLKELEKEFDASKINKAAPRFDWQRLDWFNSFYIKQKNQKELLALSKPYFEKITENEKLILKIIEVQKPRIKCLSEITAGINFVFNPPRYPKELLFWKKMKDQEVWESLEQARKILEKIPKKDFENLAKISEILLSFADPSDRGKLLWPLRVALSGEKQSPSPFECAYLLGKKESLQRIKIAQKKLAN